MSAPCSNATPDDEIMARFARDLETAEDSDTVIRAYCAGHPSLADEIRALAAMMQKVDRSRPELAVQQPTQLGEFRIIRRIDHGGQGEIYEAVQERLHRRVAVKIIRRGHISPDARARFLREQQVLAQLHQTHIVPIHTAGEEGSLQYFVMPYIEGAALDNVVRAARLHEPGRQGSKTPTLAELAGMVTRDGKNGAATQDFRPESSGAGSHEPHAAPELSPGSGPELLRLKLSPAYFRSVARVMVDAAAALHHAHGAGVLHRDIKPSNIMVDKHEQCWLVDFGLARFENGRAGAGPAKDIEPIPDFVTSTGVLGTSQYMSPEQFDGKADVRADVWGLGVTLYELLTLRRAFDGPTHQEIRTKVLSKEQVAPRKLIDKLPPDLAAICAKAMQKDAVSRYQTAHEFGEDLNRWLRWEPTNARPARTPRRVLLWARRNKGWAVAITLALFAIVGAFVFEKRKADLAHRETLIQNVQLLRLSMHRDGWTAKARRLLQEAAEFRKDGELQNQAAASLMGLDARPFKSFTQFGASSLAFDHGSKRLLIGGWPNQVARVWDSKTDDLFPSKQAGAGPVGFRPDGTPLQLIADPKDRLTLLLWDVAKQQLIRSFKFPAEGPQEPLTDRNAPQMALSTDGALMAASTVLPNGSSALAAWDTQTGNLLHQFVTKVSAWALSPDGKCLAGGDEDGHIRIWSLPKGEQLETFNAGRMDIQSLAFGRDAHRHSATKPGRQIEIGPWLLASGDKGGAVTIWDLQSGTRRSSCFGCQHRIYAIAFSPDGTTMAAADRYVVRLWDMATGRMLLFLEPGDTVTGLAFSPDGQQLACSVLEADPPTRVHVWNLENGRGVQAMRGLIGQVFKICFSPDARFVAGLAMNWQIAIWDLRTSQLVQVLDVDKGRFVDNCGLAFSHDGGRFVFSAGRNAKLWDVATGKLLASWELPPGLQDALAFSKEDKLTLARFEIPDGKRWVCKLRSLLVPNVLKPIAEIEDFDRAFGIFAPPYGSCFVVQGKGPATQQKQTFGIFDWANGNRLWSAPESKSQDAGLDAIDPAGKILAFHYGPGHDNNLLMEIPSGKLLGSYRPLSSLSPGAKYGTWFEGQPRNGISLLRPEEKSALVTLGIDLEVFCHPHFSPSGKHLAWGNTDGSVTVCDINEIRRRLTELGLGW